MAVIAKKTKIKQKSYIETYTPNLIRSHPFYLIYFPLITLLTSMFYWFILCPLVFSKCLAIFEYNYIWPVYFWVTAFIIYLILLAVLICWWRCSCRKKDKIVYTINVEDSENLSCDNSIELKELPQEEVITKCAEDDDDDEDNISDQDGLFPRCSVRQKRRPKSLVLSEQRPVSQNLSSPLTPRELFFIDLIEGANKSYSSMTRSFIEKEKLHYSPDGPLVKYSDEDTQKCASPSEFFIANIPVEQTCTSQVFLYVDEDEDEVKPQIQLTCGLEEVTFID